MHIANPVGAYPGRMGKTERSKVTLLRGECVWETGYGWAGRGWWVKKGMERGSYRIWDMTQDRKTGNFFRA